MGLAISGMHYTGMRAAIFTAHAPVHEAQANASLDQTNLALGVAGVNVRDFGLRVASHSLFEAAREERCVRRGRISRASTG